MERMIIDDRILASGALQFADGVFNDTGTRLTRNMPIDTV